MKYAWSVPEVTQSSQMDCGPACLKSVLQGFNIPVHFGRLREACQTSVDGTSVNVVEELACELGLDAQQVLVPINNLHLPEVKTTPSILITQLPSNMTHFVVLWRSVGPWVQVMDPAHGRHWMRWDKLKDQAYPHHMSLPKTMWRDWANGDESKLVLTRRLTDLGLSTIEIQNQFALTFRSVGRDQSESATTDNWLAIASLDAITSWTESLLLAKAIKKGDEAVKFINAQYARTLATEQPWLNVIPRQYWWVIQDENNGDAVKVEASVLVRINGKAEKTESKSALEKKLINPLIRESESSPWAIVYKTLLPQQRQLARWLIPIIFFASATVALQALLFQGLLGVSSLLGQQQEFSSFIPMVFTFIALSALMEIPIAKMTLTLGRQLEGQFRIILFNKIPKIHDPYFRSRLLTDMAMRSHKLFVLRLIPAFVVAMFQQLSLIIFTLIGLLWLDFFSGLIACAMAVLLLIMSFFGQKILHDLMARAETQAGVLGMFYFDALKGLKAIRSHAAQATFENEQEIQLSRWGVTHYLHQRKKMRTFLLLDLVTLLTIAALMLSKTMNAEAIAPSVLWFYWILRLPYLVKNTSALIMDLPQYGVTLSRFAELLDATEVEQMQPRELQVVSTLAQLHPTGEHDNNTDSGCAENIGVTIELTNASLSIAGHWVLNDINLQIKAGQHIAIVGESGAGKSSICELLLGWQSPTAGEIRVDGNLLQGDTLLQLRQQTAWVDANVQLWNRSLLENLNYDHGNGRLSDAGLGPVLASLPDGLQTSLGEGGKRLSGGEGQRVRIARALGVDKPRLVILDEPCRSLDRTAREQLLQKIRTTHANATLICITHDISEAVKFPHVVVVDQGTILEQGDPQLLLEKSGSAFSRLRKCEQQVLQTILQNQVWEQLHLVDGQLQSGAMSTQLHNAANQQQVTEHENA